MFGTARRELRAHAGRLAAIAGAVGMGVATFMAITAFSDAAIGAVHDASRRLLGADVVVASTRPLDAATIQAITRDRDVEAYATMVELTALGHPPSRPDAARPVVVRAVTSGYPLRGALIVAGGARTQVALAHGVVVEPELAHELGLDVREGGTVGAASLVVAGYALPVAGLVTRDDAQQARALTLGRRVYVDLARVREAGLLDEDVPSTTHLLLRVRAHREQAVVRRIMRLAAPSLRGARVETHDAAALAIAEPVRAVTGFLRLVSTLALLLAAVSATSMIHALLETRRDDARVLVVLGAPPSLPARAHAVVVAVVIGIGTVLGAVFGLAVAARLPLALGPLLPEVVQGARTPPPVVSLALAVALLVVMAAPAVRGVARRERPRDRLDITCAAVASALSLALVVRAAERVTVGLAIGAALAALAFVQIALVRVALRGLRRASSVLPLAPRLAVGQLAARESASVWVACALGAASFLALAPELVARDLVAPLVEGRVEGRPNVFLYDVPEATLGEVRAIVRRATGEELDHAVVAQVRIVSVGGVPAERIDPELTRERPATARTRLASTERVVSGQMWPRARTRRAEVSLEAGFARSIGARLGDEIVLSIQGQPRRARVTSTRRVHWLSFAPNFVLVLHPSLLEDVPVTYFGAVHTRDTAARRRLAAALATRAPSVVLIDLADFAAKAAEVLDLVARAATFVAAATAIAALLVLVASLVVGRLAREREVALLRCLGAADRLIVHSVLVELALIGALPAAVGAGLAVIAASAYGRGVLGLGGAPSLGLALGLVAAATAATLLAGLATIGAPLRRPPLDVIRGE